MTAAKEAFGSRDMRWWLYPENEVHSSVNGSLDRLRDSQEHRRRLNLHHWRIFDAKAPIGDIPMQFNRADPTPGIRMNLNVTRNIINSVNAKTCKSRPKPTFLTEDGDFTIRRRAKLLERFCEGMFTAVDIFKKGSIVSRDAMIFGLGCVKVFVDNDSDEICVERVLPGELVVDDVDGMYGDPRTFYQVKQIDRAVLAEMYPEHVQEIRESKSFYVPDGRYRPENDRISVYEAWHLPSSKNAGDGRHVICLDNVTLFDEPYDQTWVPFVFLRWSESVTGFYGDGLVEEIAPIQMEINRLVRNIQMAQHLASVPRIFVEHGSKVVKSHLTNDIGAIVEYTGQPPIVSAPSAVSPDLYAHLDRLYKRAYDTVGVSELSAHSAVPAGLDGGSGKALQVYNDIESERFILYGRAYEQFFIDVAKLMIRCARDVAARTDNFHVTYRGGKFLQKIRWDEVDLEDDMFDMVVFPTSMLASTPSARIRQVESLAQAGWITPEQAKRLLDFPDIERENALEQAAYDASQRHIEDILYHDRDDVIPEPFDDLALCKEQAQAAYLKARNDGAPEDRLDALRRFIEDCIATMQAASHKAQGPGPEMAPPPPMPPGGPEMPLPPPGAPPGVPPEMMAALPGGGGPVPPMPPV